MEHLGNLLAANASMLTQKTSEETLEAQETRRRLVEAQLKRISLSQGAEAPSAVRLSLLVTDALRLWMEIPSEGLAVAVDEGLIAAGSFPCNAGTVAKAWRGKMNERKLELGAGRMSESDSAKYLVWLDEQGKIAKKEREEGFQFQPPRIA